MQETMNPPPVCESSPEEQALIRRYPPGTIIYSKLGFAYYVILDVMDEQTQSYDLALLCRVDALEEPTRREKTLTERALRSDRWFVCNVQQNGRDGFYALTPIVKVHYMHLRDNGGLEGLAAVGFGFGQPPENYCVVDFLEPDEKGEEYVAYVIHFTKRFWGLWTKKQRKVYALKEALLNYPIFLYEMKEK